MFRRRSAAIVGALVMMFVLGSISVSMAADPKSSQPQSGAAGPAAVELAVAPTTTGTTYVSFGGSNFTTRASDIAYAPRGSGMVRYQTAANSEIHVARLDLPQGSKITEVVWYVWDNDATLNPNLNLTRWGADGAWVDVSTLSTIGSTAAVQTLTANLSASPLIVDNRSNTYVLQARLRAGTDTVQLYGARVGYLAPTFSFAPIAPARILDTRAGTGLTGPFSSGSARTFQVTGLYGVPADAVAVTGNLTVTEQTSRGFVALTPAPTNNPFTSTLNFPVGDNRANGVTVALSGTGTLSATYMGEVGTATTQLIFDVTGYFAP